MTAPNETEPSAGAKPGEAPRRVGWPAASAVVALCLLAGFGLYECSPGTQAGKLADASTQTAHTVLKGAEQLVAALNKTNITETFREHLESSQPDLAGRLLLVEDHAQEDFKREDTPWWGVAMDTTLGTTTSEIQVPVTYRYYVALSEPWDLRVQVTPQGVLCDVVAPALKPLPDPAPDLSRMEIKSANGWFRDDKDAVQADLMKDITDSLNRRAFSRTPEHFALARAGVEKFVKDWLLQQYGLPPDLPIYLRIAFRNEPGAPASPAPSAASAPSASTVPALSVPPSKG